MSVPFEHVMFKSPVLTDSLNRPSFVFMVEILCYRAACANLRVNKLRLHKDIQLKFLCIVLNLSAFYVHLKTEFEEHRILSQ